MLKLWPPKSASQGSKPRKRPTSLRKRYPTVWKKFARPWRSPRTAISGPSSSKLRGQTEAKAVSKVTFGQKCFFSATVMNARTRSRRTAVNISARAANGKGVLRDKWKLLSNCRRRRCEEAELKVVIRNRQEGWSARRGVKGIVKAGIVAAAVPAASLPPFAPGDIVVSRAERIPRLDGRAIRAPRRVTGIITDMACYRRAGCERQNYGSAQYLKFHHASLHSICGQAVFGNEFPDGFC